MPRGYLEASEQKPTYSGVGLGQMEINNSKCRISGTARAAARQTTMQAQGSAMNNVANQQQIAAGSAKAQNFCPRTIPSHCTHLELLGPYLRLSELARVPPPGASSTKNETYNIKNSSTVQAKLHPITTAPQGRAVEAAPKNASRSVGGVAATAKQQPVQQPRWQGPRSISRNSGVQVSEVHHRPGTDFAKAATAAAAAVNKSVAGVLDTSKPTNKRQNVAVEATADVLRVSNRAAAAAAAAARGTVTNTLAARSQIASPVVGVKRPTTEASALPHSTGEGRHKQQKKKPIQMGKSAAAFVKKHMRPAGKQQTSSTKWTSAAAPMSAAPCKVTGGVNTPRPAQHSSTKQQSLVQQQAKAGAAAGHLIDVVVGVRTSVPRGTAAVAAPAALGTVFAAPTVAATAATQAAVDRRKLRAKRLDQPPPPDVSESFDVLMTDVEDGVLSAVVTSGLPLTKQPTATTAPPAATAAAGKAAAAAAAAAAAREAAALAPISKRVKTLLNPQHQQPLTAEGLRVVAAFECGVPLGAAAAAALANAAVSNASLALSPLTAMMTPPVAAAAADCHPHHSVGMRDGLHLKRKLENIIDPNNHQSETQQGDSSRGQHNRRILKLRIKLNGKVITHDLQQKPEGLCANNTSGAGKDHPQSGKAVTAAAMLAAPGPSAAAAAAAAAAAPVVVTGVECQQVSIEHAAEQQQLQQKQQNVNNWVACEHKPCASDSTCESPAPAGAVTVRPSKKLRLPFKRQQPAAAAAAAVLPPPSAAGAAATAASAASTPPGGAPAEPVAVMYHTCSLCGCVTLDDLNKPCTGCEAVSVSSFCVSF